MSDDLITTKYGFKTSKARSKHMSKISGKDTKPEIELRKALWANGIRYRKNYTRLPGKPDIAITKLKVAIFIDGAFWHGYNWTEKKKRIRSNREYWIPKIEKNIERDKANNAKLKEMGWKVIRYWDFEVKKNLPQCIEHIISTLKKRGTIS